MNETYKALTRLRIKFDETSADISTWDQSSSTSWSINEIAEEAALGIEEVKSQIEELREAGFVWTVWDSGSTKYGHNKESHHLKHKV